MIPEFKHKFYIFVTLFIVTITNSFSQVNANFIANDSVGCNSLIVSFTNLSSGTGDLTYSWESLLSFDTQLSWTRTNDNAGSTNPTISPRKMRSGRCKRNWFSEGK